MLYGNESISSYSRHNIIVWMTMALQAGLINVGAFMACHRFASHVTGFATFFGSELTHENNSHAVGMLVVPLFFLLGSMLSGVLVDLKLKQQRRPQYWIIFGVVFFLLALVLTMGLWGHFGKFGVPLDVSLDYTLLILLCLTCGVQNGAVSTVSKSVIRTTHLTGLTTDLGIGIVRYLNRKNIGPEALNEGRANLMRIGIISFFCIGSVLGAFIFKFYEFRGFWAPAITSGGLFFLMFYHQVLKRNDVAGKAY